MTEQQEEQFRFIGMKGIEAPYKVSLGPTGVASHILTKILFRTRSDRHILPALRDFRQQSFWENSMLDIDGFLTSTQFITQLASFITAILTALLGSVVSGVFGSGGAGL